MNKLLGWDVYDLEHTWGQNDEKDLWLKWYELLNSNKTDQSYEEWKNSDVRLS